MATVKTWTQGALPKAPGPDDLLRATRPNPSQPYS